uniref:Somatostatin receptor type 3-like n=1 Tax=Saccoglossus kowalevskii TaxID=10224 RepID=A0ABM0N0F5_SACKO|nr:PREDICTED: somatostatin receptor type 3-like [Saccoglossus kowalevskii]
MFFAGIQSHARYTADTGLINENDTNNFTIPMFPDALPAWFFLTLLPMLSLIFCVFGLIGNGMVLFVRKRIKQSIHNIYIINLASADFLFLLGVLFLNYFNTTKQWVFGSTICKLVVGIDGMNMFTSIFTLTIMAVDRFVAVVYAVSSRNYRTESVARKICLGMWVLSATTALPLWILKRKCIIAFPIPDSTGIRFVFYM